ncbi:MAG: pyridoxine 5'-phosphate synthase [Planctomycetes bacterium]|nr:pyridoxine 5'-phosphate synthase [Planctomycetota bacterium]MCA8934594.1 pyridoxine 5'-phosphate synthase [Planctomycetota bacterium]
MTLLGLNVDHVATIRNARGGKEPDPVHAAMVAEQNGADSIVCHLREDRRHIKDRDVRLLRDVVQTSLQLEMALNAEIIKIAVETKPDEVMIVPERRGEVTTEAGFDAVKKLDALKSAVDQFKQAGIGVCVFIDANMDQVVAAHKAGANTIELHTGPYSHARGDEAVDKELDLLETAAHRGWELGLDVHAGHGLNYHNVQRLLRQIPVEKVNIGHAVVSRAIFSGFENAVRDMKGLIAAAS